MRDQIKKEKVVTTNKITAAAATVGSVFSLIPFHIRRGNVYTVNFDKNNVTTISSHDEINANTAPARIPGLIEGIIIRWNVVHRDAPKLRDACSSLTSNPARDAETVIKTNGAARTV